MAKATIFDRVIQSALGAKSSWDSVFLKNLDMSMLRDDVLDSPYSKSDLVFTCVSTTARAIAQVPFLKYIPIDAEGGGSDYSDEQDFEPAPEDDPWQQLLGHPNEMQDPYKFMEGLVSWYLLEGTSFVVPFPPSSEVPASLWVVGLKNMKPNRDGSTGQLLGWEYSRSGSPGKAEAIPLGPGEVLPFATWNPADPILGQAPITAGTLNVKTDFKATSYNERFFDNSCIPAGVITTPPGVRMGSTGQQRLRENIEGDHLGHKRAWRLLYLERGLKYEQMALNQEQMQFAELKARSREAIMQCFGMKKAVISVTEDLNYATAQSQKAEWWESTNLPIMSMISFVFTHYFIGKEGVRDLALSRYLRSLRRTSYKAWKAAHKRVTERRLKELRRKEAAQEDPVIQEPGYFDFDTSVVKALQEDFSKRVDTATKLWAMGFAANEINQRLELGFDDKNWRDAWWSPMGLTPVDAESYEDDKEELEEEPDDQVPPMLPPLELPGDEEEGGNEDFPPPVEDGLSVEVAKKLPRKRWEMVSEQVWKGIVRRSWVIEEKYSKKVTRTFYDMRRRAMRYLVEDHNPEGLMQESFREEMKLLAKWLLPIYREAALLGIQSLVSQVPRGSLRHRSELEQAEEKIDLTRIDIDFDMDEDPVLLGNLASRTSLITSLTGTQGIDNTLKRKIHGVLSRGMAEGESIGQLADRVRGVFRMSATRAKTIARTEVISTSNYGRSAAMKETTFEKKRWWTALDERVRDSHVAMHGKVIPMEDSWVVTSMSGKAAGTQCTLAYPGDRNAGAPQETINCRCLEIPVVGGEEEEG